MSYAKILFAFDSSRRLFGFDFKKPWVDPPEIYSITRTTYVSVSITS